MGVVWAVHSLPVGEQLGERGGGTSRIPRLPLPGGAFEASGQGGSVVWAETATGGVRELMEVGGGSEDLAGFPKAHAAAE
jgi:hypothetical protein